MKMYARIEGGDRVAEVIATDGDITVMYHPDMVWVECATDTVIGDTYQDGVFTRPVVPVDTRSMNNAALLAEIAAVELSQGRALRETALGMLGAKERLQAIDAKIAVLRGRIV